MPVPESSSRSRCSRSPLRGDTNPNPNPNPHPHPHPHPDPDPNPNPNQVSTEESSHSERVASVAFSPDGKTILSGSHDKSIATWDADAVLLDAKEG